ncbi:hypothetical protein L226DRAFT_539989 [Lentinus tigrinus ALCF2SS1-7]|uniref:uncharacterized protein n=1 Tax=Lentinus tigrinus ALCF2SS1-7 TaxID=1328758 RepID=UPI001165F649|nr:hypothetical protein L226DRAFT_539989 [Lentinus tigrinus ALCF2SS1-7]
MAERVNPNMLFANFNQDFTCISVGTKKGYSITNVEPFGRVYTMNDGVRGIVEMLFCTSLLALVGAADHPQSSPRKLQIVNTKRQSMICELLFPSSILAVKLNRKTPVIVLEVEIYIYDISNMKLLHVIETTPNPNAIVALSPSADNSYLAYPSPVPSPALSQATLSQQPMPPFSAPSTGDVLLFSTRSLTVANVIQAHKSPISFLSINSSGTMLATASKKEALPFRRGTREDRIYSIHFNIVSTLLVSPSSPSGSIDSREGSQGLDGGRESYVERMKGGSVWYNPTSSVGGCLPNTLTEMWKPSRESAFLRLPTSGARMMPQVMVLSSEGYFYSSNIDLGNGGECSSMHLLDSNDEAAE